MALKKVFEDECGRVSEYWKIENSHYSHSGGLMTVSIALYVDEAARQADKAPVKYHNTTFEAAENTSIHRDDLYPLVKQNDPYLADAEDLV